MPVLRNERHELFAQGLAKGHTERAAYIAAGYKPDDANANKLTRKHQILTRVRELQEASQERTVTTLETVSKALWQAHEDNKGETGSQSARIQALATLAKLHGLETDPRKNARAPMDDVLSLIDGKTRDIAGLTKH